jgi:Peptidase family M28
MSAGHRVVAAIAAVVALALAFAWPQLPTPLAATAPATEFSAERAMEQLRRIAARPHPTGTSADDEVRERIATELWALGFTVEVQDTTSLTDLYAARFGTSVVAAHVRNVIARRPGTTRGPALMLMAHYDSRELAPGASDDGFGVVALLETARALAASQPLRHDVVLLFTEGEEHGLMGARAFFAEHPAARDVGLVLNFEARGDRGPVVMFQTSEGAAGLVDALASAVPDVFASSLSQEVYRRMPNDSDLTVALQAGLPSMNFANIDGFERYHQWTDTVANASPATVQHHGSYALALARAFGDAEPMVPPTRGDEVYFDLGPIFVHYRTRLALPLAIGVAAVAALAIVAGARRRLRVGRIIVAAGVAAIAPVVAAAVAAGVGWVAMHAGGADLAMQTARDGVKAAYDGAMAALGVSVAWAVLNAARARGVRHGEMAAGSLVVMVLLAVVSAALLPGGSFLFVWPAAAMAVAAIWPRVPAYALAATIALMTVVSLARQLGVTFGPPIAPAIAAISGIATTATFPLLEIIAGARRWSPPLALGGASLAAVATAIAWPAFDEATPRPDSLLYVVDADHASATWRSTDPAPDAWTSRMLSAATWMPVSDVFPRSKRKLLSAPAPFVDVGRPDVDVVSDERDGDTRTLRLHIGVAAGTETLLLAVPPESHVATASVEGRAFSTEHADGWLDLVYFGPPPRGLEVTITAPAAAPIPVHLLAQLRGLPATAGPLAPRPAGVMPAVSWNPLYASDMTLTTMSHIY